MQNRWGKNLFKILQEKISNKQHELFAQYSNTSHMDVFNYRLSEQYLSYRKTVSKEKLLTLYYLLRKLFLVKMIINR